MLRVRPSIFKPARNSLGSRSMPRSRCPSPWVAFLTFNLLSPIYARTMERAGKPPFEIRYRDRLFAWSDLTKPEKIECDEIWQSYYWWICRLNGFQFREDRRPLRANINGSKRTSCLEEFLAWIADLSRDAFTQDHTLLPLYRAVNQEPNPTSFLGETIRTVTSIRGTSEEILCCPQCLKSDIDSTGRPIWRRTHQIPGAFWCQLHPDTPLEVVSHPLSNQPSAIKNPKFPTARMLDPWKSIESIRNFMRVTELLLRRSQSLHRRQLEFAIYERAYALGFSVRPSDSLPLLSSHISQTLPEAWLSSLNFKNGRIEICSHVESVLYWSQFCSERMVYPLLIATLWQDMGEVLIHQHN